MLPLLVNLPFTVLFTKMTSRNGRRRLSIGNIFYFIIFHHPKLRQNSFPLLSSSPLDDVTNITLLINTNTIIIEHFNLKTHTQGHKHPRISLNCHWFDQLNSTRSSYFEISKKKRKDKQLKNKKQQTCHSFLSLLHLHYHPKTRQLPLELQMIMLFY